jgi:hypothetical protein
LRSLQLTSLLLMIFKTPTEHYAKNTKNKTGALQLKHFKNIHHHHHHQPINVPSAGAQALLMDHTEGEGAMTRHASPGRIGDKCSWDQRLNVPSEARMSWT